MGIVKLDLFRATARWKRYCERERSLRDRVFQPDGMQGRWGKDLVEKNS